MDSWPYRLTERHRGAPISRRHLLLSLPALAMAPRTMAQAGKTSLHVRALNHMTLTVSDVKRSVQFYQGLFGMPIQARQGQTVLLRIGSGPQFVALSGAGPNANPHINHFCFTVDNFDVDRIVKLLAEHGVTRSEPAAGGTGFGLSGGPMKLRVRMRGPEAGGAKEGTPELYLGDPDGIVVQLQDVRYCGGAGALGEVCSAMPEASPQKGWLTVRDLSHFTMRVSDPRRSNRFYQDLFGLPIQAHQGAAPILGIARGPQFIMCTGLAGPTASAVPSTASIHHACLSVDDFNVDRIFKSLAEFGLKPRGDAPGPAGPLTYYVTMRMPDRGGAPGGTPELYFTDPDGLIIQLQDQKYCGGSGYLGDVCA